MGFPGAVQGLLMASILVRDAGVHVAQLSGFAGPFAGFSDGPDSLVFWPTGWVSDPVVRLSRFVKTLAFPLPTNVDVVDVPTTDGHRLSYFPDGRPRAPAAGYRAAIEARTFTSGTMEATWHTAGAVTK